jgi:hypothetical protein
MPHRPTNEAIWQHFSECHDFANEVSRLTAARSTGISWPAALAQNVIASAAAFCYCSGRDPAIGVPKR